MKQLFIVNVNENIEKSYEDLLNDINALEFTFHTSIQASNIYDLYLQLIRSIMLNEEVKFDASNLSGQQTSESVKIKNPYQGLTFDSLVETLQRNSKWGLEMATSGTTGVPKKVVHSFTSLTRSVKINHKRKGDVWGLAYNPQHMAGLQVFFQALLNKNTIVNIFGLNKNQIYTCIKDYQISHISATPTFYKLLLPANDVFNNVKQITFGGEKFSEGLQSNLIQLFPNAKFTNVYASTEAGALFAAEGNNFTINEKIKHLIKIEENELVIHSSLIANSADLKLENGWYYSGDLVNILTQEPITFNFISRKNEMINIGGSKVNPNDVEELIIAINGISDAKVFGKANSLMGNILCADVVRVNDSLSEKEIKTFLKEKLPEYMVPRIIKFVSEIAVTATGKKSRI